MGFDAFALLQLLCYRDFDLWLVLLKKTPASTKVHHDLSWRRCVSANEGGSWSNDIIGLNVTQKVKINLILWFTVSVDFVWSWWYQQQPVITCQALCFQNLWAQSEIENLLKIQPEQVLSREAVVCHHAFTYLGEHYHFCMSCISFTTSLIIYYVLLNQS